MKHRTERAELAGLAGLAVWALVWCLNVGVWIVKGRPDGLEGLVDITFQIAQGIVSAAATIAAPMLGVLLILQLFLLPVGAAIMVITALVRRKRQT